MRKKIIINNYEYVGAGAITAPVCATENVLFLWSLFLLILLKYTNAATSTAMTSNNTNQFVSIILNIKNIKRSIN